MTSQFNDMWLLNATSNSWKLQASDSKFHPPAISKHTMTLVDDEWLFVMGGQRANGEFSSGDLFHVYSPFNSWNGG